MIVSKFEAATKLGVKIPIKKGDKVLYLGASHGVTAQKISKIVGEKGFVFCLDISPEVVKKLLTVCVKHKNMAPLLFDAKFPEMYKVYVTKVDVIYQDLAQRNQTKILIKNAKTFLKKSGYVIFLVKAKSIDSVKDEEEVYEEQEKILKENNFQIIQTKKLDPYKKGHKIMISQKF